MAEHLPHPPDEQRLRQRVLRPLDEVRKPKPWRIPAPVMPCPVCTRMFKAKSRGRDEQGRLIRVRTCSRRCAAERAVAGLGRHFPAPLTPVSVTCDNCGATRVPRFRVTVTHAAYQVEYEVCSADCFAAFARQFQ